MLTLMMTHEMASLCLHCAGLGSGLAVDDLTSKLALPLSSMPGSMPRNTPMTPRSAMLTPRRLGLSGAAKVS